MAGCKTNPFSKTYLFLLIFISSVFLGMQQNPPSPKGASRIYVEYADSTAFAERTNPDVIVLKGNVRFRHDSTFMFCDSAYLYNAENSLDAFGNVRVEQGDTLFIYGNYLKYEGNHHLAKMRENVRMINNDEVTLFTDHLDYDRAKNIGYYFDGGMIVDSINELSSVYGQYSPDTKIAFFKDEVKLVNPQFVLTSDTLKYNTETKIADILGYSEIVGDSGFIYSRRGWYNTLIEESMLFDRSIVVSKDETKTITADSMFYAKLEGYLKAYGDMVINDTTQKVIIMGEYGYYDEIADYAFATDRAQMIEYSQKDSLFLHADTLKMETKGEEREIKAYYGVRFFREDLQGVCDSMQFNTADSLLYMYKNPILWNTGYQINGDVIKILFNDSTLERMDVLNYAFATEQKDTTYFNQLKGRFLYAYFTGGELSRIDVKGATESIYYPIDEKDASFVGRNKTASDNMTIWIENRKPARIRWLPATTSEMLPIPDLNPENKFLKGFIDYNYLRPQNKEAIFSVVQMKEEDVPAPRRRKGQHLEHTPESDHQHDHDHDLDHDSE